jgi:uncharacterized protein DUF4291
VVAHERRVRAAYTNGTVTVYQAYSPEIARPATIAGRLVPPFKRERMTWIKPSFLWMMYRSGWATKPGQERVLAIEITRTGFEWALAHSALSHFDARFHESRDAWKASQAQPVRIQWDPERNFQLQPTTARTIQIGLGAGAVDRYVDEWTVGIQDVTELAHAVRDHVQSGDQAAAAALIPQELPYPLSAELKHLIGAID